MGPLNAKIVLITGANRGVGRALADRFLTDGATCVLTVRTEDAVKQLRAALSSYGDRVVIERCDIAKEHDVTSLHERVASRFGRVDILVNNAGYFATADRDMHADTLEREVLQETLDVNLFGTIAMCRAFSPSMPHGGRIINVSSTMGQLDDGGLPDYAVAYSVSKTAVNAYTSALANQLAPRAILVDSVHPGWVKTDMGGDGAKITPQAATETIAFLAAREPGETGKFWFEKAQIAW